MDKGKKTREVVKTSVIMDLDVFKTLKHTVVDRNITISACLQEAVIEYLKKYGWDIKIPQPE